MKTVSTFIGLGFVFIDINKIIILLILLFSVVVSLIFLVC
jgi:hypothetical protein